MSLVVTATWTCDRCGTTANETLGDDPALIRWTWLPPAWADLPTGHHKVWTDEHGDVIYTGHEVENICPGCLTDDDHTNLLLHSLDYRTEDTP